MKQPNIKLCPTCYTRNKFDGDMCVRCEGEKETRKALLVGGILHREQHTGDWVSDKGYRIKEYCGRLSVCKFSKEP